MMRFFKVFSPPSGPSVRRMVGFIMIGLGVAREAGRGQPLSFGPDWLYGSLLIVFGALLIVTWCNRTTWYSRGIAVASAPLVAVMAVAAWQASAASAWTMVVLLVALMGEAGARRTGC